MRRLIESPSYYFLDSILGKPTYTAYGIGFFYDHSHPSAEHAWQPPCVWTSADREKEEAFSTQLHFHEAHATSGDLRECEQPRGLDDEELVRRAPQQLLALVGRVEHDLG